MPDIYLYLDQKETGPYQSGQVNELLKEGKIGDQTLAWHEGMAEWKSVREVVAALPDESPASSPDSLSEPILEENGYTTAEILKAIVTGIVICLTMYLAYTLVYPPSSPSPPPAKPDPQFVKQFQWMVAGNVDRVHHTSTIVRAMRDYATSHHGQFPQGSTSTEVFQQLLDSACLKDPSVLYLPMPGKVMAHRRDISAQNVCFDVTDGEDAYSANNVPLVFSTGYKVNYSPGAAAVPIPGAARWVLDDPQNLQGMMVVYNSASIVFLSQDSDGTIPNFIPPVAVREQRSYSQLTPGLPNEPPPASNATDVTGTKDGHEISYVKVSIWILLLLGLVFYFYARGTGRRSA